ncbi:PRC-barrel domain-containing protein [Microvirga sp. BSC39]|uniref:PRC-barrel domain-containing protein n=1 Tax=Microvirga sp. BSC39 TaxID=1549810 RepID=UPI0009DD45F4|nr:PRC-barrel domain-containing protein [Microvirga sp. BSC39]
MLKKHMAACLVVTAFAAAPALAQTSTTSPSAPTDRPAASGTGTTSTGSPAMQPGASGSSTTMSQSSSTMSQSGGMQGQFITKMESNHVMASDLIGTRVVGANNESIGDINDVIMDRNGQIMAAVVGVGGFLGIGEKDVAVPFNSLEFMNAQQAQAMNSNSGGGNNNVATTGSTTTGGATMGNTATTGSGTAGSANTTASNSSSNQNQPERVVLRMTKDQLQAAPAFDQDGGNANNSTTGSAGQSGTSTAPKQ